MTQRFEKLLEPGMIGPVKTRNRMIKTANGTSYMEPDQTCGPRMIAYYERLARGGGGVLGGGACGGEHSEPASGMTRDEPPGPDFLPCRAMTRAELEDQIDLWASAAERAYKAGFDACEINHGTCHQGNTFLSRIWNRRDDEYGAQNCETRTRFLRNIIIEAKRR